jgi:hypothetical protein
LNLQLLFERHQLNTTLTSSIMVVQAIGTKKALPPALPKKPTTTPVRKAPIANTTAKKPITTISHKPATQQKKPLPAQKKPLPVSTTQKKPFPAVKKPLPTNQTKHTSISSNPPAQKSWLTKATNGAASAISNTTSAAASGVGNMAGAVVTAAGNGVAGAGKGAGSSYVYFPSYWVACWSRRV